MKDKKSVKGKKRSKRKIFASVAIALLTLSAGLIPISATNTKDIFQEKSISSFNSIPTQNILSALPSNFDLIEEMNNLYSEPLGDSIYMKGSTMEDSLKDHDYDSYIKAIENLDGFPDGVAIIDKRDFDILAELKNGKDSIDKLREDKQ